YAHPETKRRQDAPPARRGVQIPPAIQRDQLHAFGRVRRLIGGPLCARQIGNFVVACQAPGYVAIEPLEAANGVRIEAIVYEKDAQRSQSEPRAGPISSSASATIGAASSA